MPSIKALPRRLELAARPGDDKTITMVFSPPGAIAGRTWEMTIAGIVITPVVVGDTMTVVLAGTATEDLAFGRYSLALRDTTSGNGQTVIAGRFLATDATLQVDDGDPITVVLDDITVEVTIVSGLPGIPIGGTSGQVLTKGSGTDFDAEWADAVGGSPSGAAGGDLAGTFPNPSIAARAVTRAKMRAVATLRLLGRLTAGSGDEEELTAAQVRGFLNVEDGAAADQTAAEILALLLTVDGVGSTLDADRLAGLTAAYLLARANHTGTQLAATISDFDTQVRTSRLDQMAAPTADLPLNARKITGLADPTLAQDAATRAWVLAQLAALVDSAPGLLDTLNELAAALGDDPNFAATMTTALAGKQAQSTDLSAIAALISAADKLPYSTGAGTWALATFTAFARTLLDDPDAATMRTTLGLGTLATLSAVGSAQITDGSVANGDLADMAQSTVKMRAAGAGTGPPIDGTMAQLKTALALVAADLSDFNAAAIAACSATYQPLVVVTDVPASGAAQTLDCGGGQAAFIVTETADCVYTLDGAVAGVECIVTLVRYTGGFTPTLPAAGWANDLPIPATVADGKLDVFSFVTYDGGTTWIGSAHATNVSLPAVPSVPLNLTATPASTQVALDWDTPATNFPAAASYKIYRRVGGGSYGLLTTVSGTSHTDTGLTNDTEYGYKVSAVNTIGEGAQTAEQAATPTAPAEALDTFTAAGALSNLETGQPWVVYAGTWTKASGRVTVTVLASGNAFVLVENIGVTDGVFSIDIAPDSRFNSVYFREVDFSNHWMLQTDLALNETKLIKTVADVVTTVATVSGGLIGGVANTYEIQMAGSSIIVLRDSVEIINITDAANSAGDGYGMRTFGGPSDGGFFDNFSVNAA